MANGFELEDVIAYIRGIARRGGQYGDTVLTWRGPKISYVRNEQGYQGGDLPLTVIEHRAETLIEHQPGEEPPAAVKTT